MLNAYRGFGQANLCDHFYEYVAINECVDYIMQNMVSDYVKCSLKIGVPM